MSVINSLFTERFRPTDLKSLIAPARIKKQMEKGLIQNILLYGSAGTGKTSLGYILSKPYTTLYINASSERGIDTIREKIGKFCSTMALDNSKLKCVFLDEMDSATNEFYSALRAVMEKYAGLARFIATANYINKIPEPIQSRFNCISFNHINEDEKEYLIGEYKKRIALIMDAAKISYTDAVIDKFVRNDYPDMRSLLNKLQSLYLQEEKELTDQNFNINVYYKDLFEICLHEPNKPYENYKMVVSKYADRIDESLDSLSKDFIEYLKTNASDKIDKIPLVIIAIAEHQAQRTLVIDSLVTLLSCIYKIQIILNS